MSVHLLKDGRWIVQYRDPDRAGKYSREYFGRGLEAEANARKRQEAIDVRSYTRRTPAGTSPLFQELATGYITARLGVNEPTTLRRLSIVLRASILPEIGRIEAIRLTHHRMDQYVAKRLKTGVRRTTVHREISDIQAILNWAVKREIIKRNPVTGYQSPKRDDAIIQPVTHQEIRMLLDHTPDHVTRALLISYYTGLRPGQELFQLKWTDIDWDQKTILIRSSRKGGPPFRIVPLHPDFAGILKELDEKDAENEDFSSDYIITFNGRPVKSIRTALARAKKKAGITRRLTPYTFRHTFATRILSGGGDLKATSEILGHSRTDTTTRIYQHTDLAAHRNAIANLPALDLPKKTRYQMNVFPDTTCYEPGK